MVSLMGALLLSLLVLDMELGDTLLCVAFEVKSAWLVIELSHFLVLTVHQVAVQQHLHHSAALVLGHVTDNIASQKSQLFDPQQLIKEGHHKVRVRIQWILLEILQPGANETLLLVLTHKHEVATFFFGDG